MFPTPEALLAKIQLGEDTFLECKALRLAGGKVASPHRHGLADELAAMANGRGGVCVLGVADDRRVEGIALGDLDAVEAWVRELVQDSITPPLAPSIERLRLPVPGTEGVPVLRVDVTPSLFVHQSPGGYFHRVGSAKRPLPPDELARLFQQRSQSRLIRFDETPVPGAPLSALSEGLWRRFCPPQSQDSPEVLLGKLGMAREDHEGVLRPSVAGLLMACADPRPWMPHAFIQAVAYRGTEIKSEAPGSLYQLDAADLVGPLDEQVLQACHFVRKNMKVQARKDMGRVDFPAYDLSAVFEALVNAVAHRDYSMAGSKVRLRLFSDRLELYSPGALPNTMSLESMAFRQAARNECITSLLAKCRIPEAWAESVPHRRTLMDRRGEGVPLILQSGSPEAPPRYWQASEHELILVIPSAIEDLVP